ncbi:MAG TPA: sortase [Candidatus Paceibacterota bacterium]|nr:sortase [Candidatus Paceibacterota bacterium]
MSFSKHIADLEEKFAAFKKANSRGRTRPFSERAYIIPSDAIKAMQANGKPEGRRMMGLFGPASAPTPVVHQEVITPYNVSPTRMPISAPSAFASTNPNLFPRLTPALVSGGYYVESQQDSFTNNMVHVLWAHKVGLSICVYTVFCIVYAVMYVAGFVPEVLMAEASLQTVKKGDREAAIERALATLPSNEIATTSTTPVQGNEPTRTQVQPVVAAPQTVQQGNDPVRIIIPKVGVDVKVANPKSTAIAVMDDYLTRGVVRYADSPSLGEGNTLIFGHSTSFKVVNNQAYKAFNGLKLLKSGDAITVRSISHEYTYQVKSVRLAKDSDIYVDFTAGKNMLTLVTCNVLGQKEDRYVVEAELVSTATLPGVNI